jgi:hypothetical protein
MSTDRVPARIASHSAEEILAHPRFAAARTDFVNAVLALYEGDSFLTRLTVEAARQVIFSMIVCLDAGSDPDDPATWPTLTVLKQQMAQYGLSSYSRRHMLIPTAKMHSADQDWLTVNYRPLHLMFPEPGFGAVMRRDRAFHRALRQVSMDFFGHGAQILSGNPDIMLFLERDAGTLILFRLVQLAGVPDDRVVELDYTRTGARLGVSRTHVRKILEDAARAELVELSGRGGQHVGARDAVRPRAASDGATRRIDHLIGRDHLFRAPEPMQRRGCGPRDTWFPIHANCFKRSADTSVSL